MAYHGPAYGLSRECQMKSQAKFSLERAREALDWVEAVLDRQLNYPQPSEGLRDQLDFAHVLKDGITLCENKLDFVGNGKTVSLFPRSEKPLGDPQ